MEWVSPRPPARPPRASGSSRGRRRCLGRCATATGQWPAAGPGPRPTFFFSKAPCVSGACHLRRAGQRGGQRSRRQTASTSRVLTCLLPCRSRWPQRCTPRPLPGPRGGCRRSRRPRTRRGLRARRLRRPVRGGGAGHAGDVGEGEVARDHGPPAVGAEADGGGHRMNAASIGDRAPAGNHGAPKRRQTESLPTRRAAGD